MENLLNKIKSIAGEKNLLTTEGDVRPYITDWRGRYTGRAACVVKPANTEEVAAIVKLCAETQTPIVPQGGNTSLCGASVPDESGTAIVLNLSRMHRVREVDADNNTLTVEAGCVLHTIQQAADGADRLFPLSLASEGTCQIGGNIATNAGGTGVLRYGNMRDLVLGLECVLPNGEVWNGLRGLRKDNTGYDLKQLFIGSEGTLGIITAAVLKLYPQPRARATALVALADVNDGLALLNAIKQNFGDRLTGFEIMMRVCLDLVFRHITNTHDPFAQAYPWYALLELTDTQCQGDLTEDLQNPLVKFMKTRSVQDAVVARSVAQSNQLWHLRENISEAQRLEGISIKHDVSVPVSQVPQFIAEASSALEKHFPGIRIVAFGHMGDGNIHFNCSKPDAQDNAAFIAQTEHVNRIVHDMVNTLNGSISAEHGIGQLKRDELLRYKSAVEIDLMRMVKKTFDPLNIMNPGKIF
ncbi:MAG: FAD-binding oxidoreductase [Burkholderiales bacterium]